MWDHNKEPSVEAPDNPDVPRCCMCDEFEGLIEVDGKLYCEKHLVERFATDEMRKAFIYSHPILWYEFFADAVDERLDTRVTAALLRALEDFDKGNEVWQFTAIYADEEFREYVKGEVA